MECNSLLTFVNSASSNIQEALGKAPKRRRNVTVKKYAENRVKRLDNKKPRNGNLSTKRKSSQLKPVTCLPTSTPSSSPASSLAQLQHANTWPVINVQSVGLPTPSANVSSFYSGSETNICLSSQSSPRIDPELESLLSELECPSMPISRRGSFESVCTSSGPSCTPPLSTLEAQVYMAEQAFSPYSDYSDELDSAYCSPNGNGNAQVSYGCSPTSVSNTMPDWCSSDLLPPMTTTCLQEVGMISSRCNWVSTQDTSPLTTTSSVTSVYDQGPPMTPTVSQLLEQYNQY